MLIGGQHCPKPVLKEELFSEKCPHQIILENAWLKYRGIHEYNTKEAAYLDIAHKFAKTIPNCKVEKLKLYEFEKPRYGINYDRYKNNALNGKVIRLSRG